MKRWHSVVVSRVEQPEHTLFGERKQLKPPLWTQLLTGMLTQGVGTHTSPAPAVGTAGSSTQLEPRHGPIAEQQFVKPGSALLGYKGQPGATGWAGVPLVRKHLLLVNSAELSTSQDAAGVFSFFQIDYQITQSFSGH